MITCPAHGCGTTDAEWQVIAWLIPAGRPGRRGGRHPRRDIIDAIRYLAHNGCVWRALPADFPPWKTVYAYHARWTANGTVDHLHNTLPEQVRQAAGRNPPPTDLQWECNPPASKPR